MSIDELFLCEKLMCLELDVYSELPLFTSVVTIDVDSLKAHSLEDDAVNVMFVGLLEVDALGGRHSYKHLH